MSAALTIREKRDEMLATITQEQDRFLALLPPTLPFARFEQIVSSAMVRNPEIALCTKGSVVLACMQAAELGLEVGGILGEAYLVPFTNAKKQCKECTLIVGYKGLVTLAYQSPRVLAIRSVLVYDGEPFHVVEGSSPRIEHTPLIGPKRDPLGSDVIAAYAVAHLSGEVTMHRVLGKADLDETKARAKSAKNHASPWHYATSAMYRKTPVRALCNTLPLSDGLRRGLEIDAQDYQSNREAKSRLGLGKTALEAIEESGDG